MQFKNANLAGKVHVLYDVTRLFTNISLEETIDIAVNLIFSHNPNLRVTIKNFKLFLFPRSQIHFLFNGKFYNRIDGEAMGSPLAPVLASIFTGFYESEW